MTLKGKIRVIRSLGIELMGLATASNIEEANIDPDYFNLVETIGGTKKSKDFPLSSSIREFSSVWENLLFKKQNVEMLFC